MQVTVLLNNSKLHFQIFDLMDAKARADCIKEIDLLKVNNDLQAILNISEEVDKMTYQNVTFPSKTRFKAYLVTHWF